MVKVLEDISATSRLPLGSLNRISNNIETLICHAVNESMHNLEPVCRVDIGIGTLDIFCDNSTISWKFTPSSTLETSMVDMIVNNKDPLVAKLEDSLQERMMNSYKELF